MARPEGINGGHLFTKTTPKKLDAWGASVGAEKSVLSLGIRKHGLITAGGLATVAHERPPLGDARDVQLVEMTWETGRPASLVSIATLWETSLKELAWATGAAYPSPTDSAISAGRCSGMKVRQVLRDRDNKSW
jgi:hypothetical protein